MAGIEIALVDNDETAAALQHEPAAAAILWTYEQDLCVVAGFNEHPMRTHASTMRGDSGATPRVEDTREVRGIFVLLWIALRLLRVRSTDRARHGLGGFGPVWYG